MAAPKINRLVDLVDRGPEDDVFYPATSNNTIFTREFRPYHNVVPDTVEIGYKGDASWGGRITVTLNHSETGDLVQWLCVRIKPASWLGPDLEAKLQNGLWDYADTTSGAIWTWAASLGTIAIQTVEFEIGDAIVETWPGEWMDIWSRMSLDAGRSGTWDSDIFAQRPFSEIRLPRTGDTRDPFTTFQATEDGFVYCWIPLAFFKRPHLAFPMAAVGPAGGGSQEQPVRVHITFRPFTEVIRRQNIARTNPCESPLGTTVVLVNKSGKTPIPWSYTLPTVTPGFDDVTIMVGVVHTEERLRESLMREPLELLYEPVKYMKFTLPTPLIQTYTTNPITLSFPLTDLNGPVQEICFFMRRTGVWQFNEWTNYGALLENDFFPAFETFLGIQRTQQPILVSARLMVGNAVWRDETEKWWRTEYAAENRGGVRLYSGMVYGFSFGPSPSPPLSSSDFLQPGGTVNASRAQIRLELTMQAPSPSDGNTYIPGWDVHVCGFSYNWMRFVKGQVGPLFKD